MPFVRKDTPKSKNTDLKRKSKYCSCNGRSNPNLAVISSSCSGVNFGFITRAGFAPGRTRNRKNTIVINNHIIGSRRAILINIKDRKEAIVLTSLLNLGHTLLMNKRVITRSNQ